MHTILQPEGWAKPIGYANGVAARGTHGLRRRPDRLERRSASSRPTISSARCARRCRTSSPSSPRPARGPQHITSMTWYFTDKAEYLANLKGIGQAYREVIGRHFPAMAAMQVVALVEDRAKVEIQAIAVVPE